MATYLIGDIQGCFDDLLALLEQAHFQPHIDNLYLAGDLVARGPDSLSVLRYVKNLGEHGHTVLGNHDLHLLAVANGIKKSKKKDHIQAILEADDAKSLLDWLRHQPLLIHYEQANQTSPGFVLTHAGIAPCWDLDEAKENALQIETLLQSDHYLWLLENMYADTPCYWSTTLSNIERYRFIINALTRMRFCDIKGGLDMNCKQPPSQAKNKALIPWFLVKNRKLIKQTLVFGHWAALGGYFSDSLLALDTGCVWGGSLTMVRWEDGQIFTRPCPIYAK